MNLRLDQIKTAISRVPGADMLHDNHIPHVIFWRNGLEFACHTNRRLDFRAEGRSYTEAEILSVLETMLLIRLELDYEVERASLHTHDMNCEACARLGEK